MTPPWKFLKSCALPDSRAAKFEGSNRHPKVRARMHACTHTHTRARKPAHASSRDTLKDKTFGNWNSLICCEVNSVISECMCIISSAESAQKLKHFHLEATMTYQPLHNPLSYTCTYACIYTCMKYVLSGLIRRFITTFQAGTVHSSSGLHLKCNERQKLQPGFYWRRYMMYRSTNFCKPL